jgi:hypothetical protein
VVVVAVGGFALAIYLQHGNFSSHLTNLLLFIGYWVAPFVGIVLTDWWWLRKGKADPRSMARLRNLPVGWQAPVASPRPRQPRCPSRPSAYPPAAPGLRAGPGDEKKVVSSCPMFPARDRPDQPDRARRDR